MKIDFDVDIDMADRDRFLKNVQHIPASIFREGEYTKHNTGVYFQNIPHFPLEGYSTIPYREAEELGFFKVDFLNNSIYTDVKSEAHLDRLMKDPDWSLLENAEIVKLLAHIGSYSDLVTTYKPQSVEQLAMLLAIIRPAKKHLIGESWENIEKEIWEPTEDGSYYFKKSHSISYAMSIVVQLNLLVEQASQSS